MNYSQLYQTHEAPRYVRGHAVSLAMVAAAAILYAILYFYYKIANKQRAAGEEDFKIAGKTEEEIAEMGDENPRYVYAH